MKYEIRQHAEVYAQKLHHYAMTYIRIYIPFSTKLHQSEYQRTYNFCEESCSQTPFKKLVVATQQRLPFSNLSLSRVFDQ